MTGESCKGKSRMGRHVTKHVVKLVTHRLFARWGAGLVPFVGIAYMGWDMQRTADAVRSLPLPLNVVSSVIAESPVKGLPPAFA